MPQKVVPWEVPACEGTGGAPLSLVQVLRLGCQFRTVAASVVVRISQIPCCSSSAGTATLPGCHCVADPVTSRVSALIRAFSGLEIDCARPGLGQATIALLRCGHGTRGDAAVPLSVIVIYSYLAMSDAPGLVSEDPIRPCPGPEIDCAHAALGHVSIAVPGCGCGTRNGAAAPLEVFLPHFCIGMPDVWTSRQLDSNPPYGPRVYGACSCRHGVCEPGAQY
mmetsp:Transcript_29732/g.74889  ORF Transcript_29732/g.74889 Transcript_29732/m.74889 type:complete len:222 (-) Transcript_29732:280-945(-)